jgi:hypothetical protein
MKELATDLASWWLARRGFTVLPRGFVGLCVGNCTVENQGNGCYYVAGHEGFPVILLNNSYLYNAEAP